MKILTSIALLLTFFSVQAQEYDQEQIATLQAMMEEYGAESIGPAEMKDLECGTSLAFNEPAFTLVVSDEVPRQMIFKKSPWKKTFYNVAKNLDLKEDEFGQPYFGFEKEHQYLINQYAITSGEEAPEYQTRYWYDLYTDIRFEKMENTDAYIFFITRVTELPGESAEFSETYFCFEVTHTN